MRFNAIHLAGDRFDARVARLERAGTGVLRYGVVLLLVVFGTAKFFTFEAQAIAPLVGNSPLLSWMLHAFGLQATSNVIGVIEIATGLAIASRPIAPVVSAIGSAAGAVTFLVTLSFLLSTPGALAPTHPANGFLVKDVVLLGACLATCSEALRSARARHRGRGEAPVSGVPATRAA